MSSKRKFAVFAVAAGLVATQAMMFAVAAQAQQSDPKHHPRDAQIGKPAPQARPAPLVQRQPRIATPAPRQFTPLPQQREHHAGPAPRQEGERHEGRRGYGWRPWG